MDQMHELQEHMLGRLMIGPYPKNIIAMNPKFIAKEHIEIFKAIKELAAEGKSTDAVAVSERLDKAGKLESIGGLGYLGKLVKDAPVDICAEDVSYH